MNKYKKGFAHIVFIAIGVVVLVGAIGTTVALMNRNPKSEEGTQTVSNNSPQDNKENLEGEMNGWKTFRNEKYGYEFKYPSNLKINYAESCVNDSSINVGEFSITRYNKDVSDPYGVAKTEFDQTNDKTPRAGGYVSPGYTTSEIKKSSIGNYFSFVNMLSLGDGGGLGFQSWPEHDALYFKAAGSNVFRAVYPTNVELYDKIVSTLKVIDNSKVTGLKTYTNTEYGFEFAYPANFSIRENNSGNTPFEYEICVSPNASDNSSQQSVQTEKYKEVIQVFVAIKNNENKNYLNSNSLALDQSSFIKENGDLFVKFQAYKNQAEILKNISSTFKPIPIKNIVSADWKNYTNTDYGFELKYPAYFGEFVKVDSNNWKATNYPVPSKSATLNIKIYTDLSSSPTLFGNYGEVTKFDLAKKQFYSIGPSSGRKDLEKKFSNGNLYVQTGEGEGGDGWWGNTTVYLVFDEKNNRIVAISTSNGPNIYNRGPKLEEISATLKFTK